MVVYKCVIKRCCNLDYSIETIPKKEVYTRVLLDSDFDKSWVCFSLITNNQDIEFL